MNKEIKQTLKQVKSIDPNQFSQMSNRELTRYRSILQHVLSRKQYFEEAVHNAQTECVSIKGEYDMLSKRISHLGANDEVEKKALTKLAKKTMRQYNKAKEHKENAFEELKNYAVIYQMADVKLCKLDYVEKQMAQIKQDNQTAKEEYIKRMAQDSSKDVFVIAKAQKHDKYNRHINFDLHDDVSTPYK